MRPWVRRAGRGGEREGKRQRQRTWTGLVRSGWCMAWSAWLWTMAGVATVMVLGEIWHGDVYAIDPSAAVEESLSSSLSPSPRIDHQAVIDAIAVHGNVRVEESAFLEMIVSEVGDPVLEDQVAEDIRAIFDIGYFSQVEARTVAVPGKPGNVRLIFTVTEKPAIAAIHFQGFEDFSESDLHDKLKTKVYTIIQESVLAQDLSILETMYYEKGYFLAQARYTLSYPNAHEVEVTFHLELQDKIYIGNVDIVGNEWFNDDYLFESMLTRPYDRMQSLLGSPYYRSDFVERDEQFLDFIYKDSGFAQVKVGKTHKVLSKDQRFMDLTYTVEEGLRYDFGEISFAGDLLLTTEEHRLAAPLQQGELFRISRLQRAIEDLTREYGNRGYAFVDVYPKTVFRDDDKRMDIEFYITPGEQVYVGRIYIEGNSKTRDNIIRRELEIHDGDLFSATAVENSQENIERLGFFESLKFVRERDKEQSHIVHYRIKVKEKSTGQIQASIGYSPQGETDANWFGQGKFQEQNFIGRAWRLSTALTYSNSHTYSVDVNFLDPRIRDSLWSTGVGMSYRKQKVITLGLDLLETTRSARVSAGRRIWKDFRGSFGLEFQRSRQDSDFYLNDSLRLSGDTIGFFTVLSWSRLNNAIDPTDGVNIRLTQRFIGGPIGGDYTYMESEATGWYYYPVNVFSSYNTHFKIKLMLAKLSPWYGSHPPLFKRYRLGGAFSLRGYNANSITPRFVFWKSPFDYDGNAYYPKGGDRKLLMQLEYYMPLISQLNMKALVFFDSGRVYDNHEAFTVSDLFSNVGFGIRWVTPIAPFRFEWAFPIREDGTLGSYKVIFNIGY